MVIILLSFLINLINLEQFIITRQLFYLYSNFYLSTSRPDFYYCRSHISWFFSILSFLRRWSCFVHLFTLWLTTLYFKAVIPTYTFFTLTYFLTNTLNYLHLFPSVYFKQSLNSCLIEYKLNPFRQKQSFSKKSIKKERDSLQKFKTKWSQDLDEIYYIFTFWC